MRPGKQRPARVQPAGGLAGGARLAGAARSGRDLQDEQINVALSMMEARVRYNWRHRLGDLELLATNAAVKNVLAGRGSASDSAYLENLGDSLQASIPVFNYLNRNDLPAWGFVSPPMRSATRPVRPATMRTTMIVNSPVMSDSDTLGRVLETAGEPLYFGLANGVASEEAGNLLRQNGREETAHAHRLKKAIEILTGEPYTIPTLDENPYGKPPAMGAVTAEMLEGLVQAEFGGDKLYQTYAANEPNPEVAALLLQNGREETRHGRRVEQAIALLGG